MCKDNKVGMSTGNARFVYDKSLKGDVFIRTLDHREVRFPIQEIFDFVADLIISKRVADLEELSTEQILGL